MDSSGLSARNQAHRLGRRWLARRLRDRLASSRQPFSSDASGVNWKAMFASVRLQLDQFKLQQVQLGVVVLARDGDRGVRLRWSRASCV